MSEIHTFRRKLGHVAVLAGLAVLPALMASCNRNPANSAATPPPPEVSVLTVHSEPVKRTTDLPGRTSAVLIGRRAAAGQRHDPDATLHRGRRRDGGSAALSNRPGALSGVLRQRDGDARARRSGARDGQAKATRYKQLVAAKTVSQQDYDDAVARAKEAQADIAIARAAIQQAHINLLYTKVLSPIAGHIGRSTVTPGALVTANQTRPSPS